jgi:hypothetical protein
MVDMHREGGSAREIAEELGVAHGSIINWLRDAGLKPNGGHGGRKSRERVSPEGAAIDLADMQKRLAEFMSRPPPKDFREVLEQYRREFAIAAGFVEYNFAEAMAGRSSMVELDKAQKVQDYYATRIRELTPTEAPDPATDPANVTAATETRRKLERLVESAEQTFRCKSCGGDPYGKGGAR